MKGIVIQARMGSSRLPGKVLRPILGKPLLAWVYERASSARKVDTVIVATTDQPEDGEVVRMCEAQGIPYFRGSEKDVLDRYYQTARFFGLRAVLRVTGDCPLTDPELLDDLVKEYDTGQWAYVSNSMPLKLPHGLEASIGSFDAFECSWREARLLSEREHVTQYIRKHPDRFSSTSLSYEPDYSHLRITVDYEEDLEVVSKIYELLDRRGLFGYYREVISILEEFPELGRHNAHFNVREGLEKSIESDRIARRYDRERDS